MLRSAVKEKETETEQEKEKETETEKNNNTDEEKEQRQRRRQRQIKIKIKTSTSKFTRECCQAFRTLLAYRYIYIYIYKGYASCRRPLDADWGLVTSGLAAQLETWEHTGHGSHFSERAEEIRSRSTVCLFRELLLAKNLDAVLVVIVKLVGDPIFAKFC